MLYDESRHSVHVCFKQLHTKCSKCLTRSPGIPGAEATKGELIVMAM